MKSSAWILALLACAVMPFACGFPSPQFSDTKGAGGNGNGNAASSSQHGGSSSTNNPVGGGGTSSMTAGGANGGGGINTGGGGASSSSGGGNPDCPHDEFGDGCDCDGDHHRKTSCAPLTDPVRPADDCADDDPRAFAGQTNFYGTPIVGQKDVNITDYDFNCNGQDDPKWVKLQCALGCNGSPVWQSDQPACGDVGHDLVTCSGALCMTGSKQTKTQLCN